MYYSITLLIKKEVAICGTDAGTQEGGYERHPRYQLILSIP